MAQWINAFQKNGFINPTQSPFLCERTGALAIVEPGIMAGRQAGKRAGGRVGGQAGRQAGC